MPKAQKTDSRQNLAEAIEHKRTAERELSAAQDARSVASRREYEARERLDAHRAAVADASASNELAERFIEANAAGDDCDVLTLTRAGVDREAELRNEIDVWSKTREACAKVVADREKDLQSAGYRVDGAARTVISEAFRPEAFAEAQRCLARLEELRAEIIAIDLNNDSLSRSEAQKSAVLTMRCMRLENDGSAVVRRQWEAFVQRLKANADEPFPFIKLET